MHPIQRRTEAFTLIEMMAVVIIIGILAAIIAPPIINRITVAEDVAARQDIRTIEQAIAFYRMDTGTYPDSIRDLTNAPASVPFWRGPYLPRIPTDPWNQTYHYLMPGNDGRPFDVWSWGSDQKEGGIEQAADLTSWEADEQP